MSQPLYTGFWRRVVAGVVDVALWTALSYPVLWLVYGGEYFTEPAPPTITQALLGRGGVDFFVSWIFPSAATVAFWYTMQATPGKLLVGARIIDARTGGKLSFVQCVVRYVASLFSIAVFLLGIAWILFDKRKQGWHDKIARTLVVQTSGEARAGVPGTAG